MNNGSTIVSCALTVLAGVFFVTGVALLSNEGSDLINGPREDIHHNA